MRPHPALTFLLAPAAPAALAFGLTLGATDAQAATYTSFWAFGDSLTDPGNLSALTGGALPPSPPYFDGRFSNGPVWAEEVAGDFADHGLATGNFAHGFARALPTGAAPGLPLDVPDLPDQVTTFDAVSDGRLGDRPVAALWFGANDVFGAVASGDPAAVVATAVAAAAAVVDGIVELATLGVRDFVVFNLPPLELTPLINLVQPQAAPLAELGSDSFNAALAAGLDGLEAEGLGITEIDIDALFEALVADPGSLGLSDAVSPCFVPPQGNAPGSLCSEAELSEKVFFDLVHPTATVHAEIADLVLAEVAPVPLPPALASMGTALLALLALRGRRRT